MSLTGHPFEKILLFTKNFAAACCSMLQQPASKACPGKPAACSGGKSCGCSSVWIVDTDICEARSAGFEIKAKRSKLQAKVESQRAKKHGYRLR